MKGFLIIIVLASMIVPVATEAQEGPQLLGRLEYDVELNDVWGYRDETGREYALVGAVDGLSVVDVTDPSNISEKAFFPGLLSTWRDIKTWNNHAYVTNESGGGLLIVDLSPLPQSTVLPYTNWIGDSVGFFTAHNLYIDENGRAYIFGAGNNTPGAVILDLNEDPMQPKVVGTLSDFYLHDGVVKGDTLWGAAIYRGEITVVDVSDKSAPQLISSFYTPGRVAHNCWISENNQYLYTTDEINNGMIGAFDVSDIQNPEMLDTWKPADTSIIPHNAHFINDFIVTSHYTYGVVIHDVSRPHNMVETGRYDTSPDYVYEGFHGAWGAYPYLPSGKLLVSDIEEGLFVFAPNYTRAAFLEGVVTDVSTGAPILFPKITVLGAGLETTGNIVGEYATGTPMAGKYDVAVQKDGYNSKLVQNVELYNGQVTFLDVQLDNYPVGIGQAANHHAVQAYPNPTNGEVTLAGPEAFEEVTVTDVYGRVVSSQAPATNVLQLETGKPAGVYLLHWKTHSTAGTIKVVVE